VWLRAAGIWMECAIAAPSAQATSSDSNVSSPSVSLAASLADSASSEVFVPKAPKMDKRRDGKSSSSKRLKPSNGAVTGSTSETHVMTIKELSRPGLEALAVVALLYILFLGFGTAILSGGESWGGSSSVTWNRQ